MEEKEMKKKILSLGTAFLIAIGVGLNPMSWGM